MGKLFEFYSLSSIQLSTNKFEVLWLAPMSEVASSNEEQGTCQKIKVLGKSVSGADRVTGAGALALNRSSTASHQHQIVQLTTFPVFCNHGSAREDPSSRPVLSRPIGIHQRRWESIQLRPSAAEFIRPSRPERKLPIPMGRTATDYHSYVNMVKREPGPSSQVPQMV